ncbi:MAG: hypothetical protein ACJAYB_002029 [Psychromonas sp.]|jgi:hypothetical protein
MSHCYASKRRDLSTFKRKTVCKFPASKGDVSPILTEGVLEADYCYHLEADPAVLKYECQPLGYYYYLDKELRSYNPLDKEQHLYTPDFKIWLDNGDIVYYEIKGRRYIDKEFEGIFFPAVQKQAEFLGSSLTLVTEEFIYSEPLFTNLKRMRKAKMLRDVPIDVSNQLVEILKIAERMSPLELFSHSDHEYDLGILYKLIGEGIINTDIEANYFGPEMSVWVDNHD